MKTLAVVFWICTAVATWSLILGNHTAINGVVGAGACALVVTSLALIDRS